MSIDYIVASLPTLQFGEPAPITWTKFAEMVGDDARLVRLTAKFADLETQLKNAVAFARVDGAKTLICADPFFHESDSGSLAQ